MAQNGPNNQPPSTNNQPATNNQQPQQRPQPQPQPPQQQQQEEEAGQHSWAPGRLSRVSAQIRLRRLHTSGLPYERPRATRALWWGAPQTADPPTPGPKKHQKSFRRVGESFLARIRVAHKRLQEHSPTPPVWRVPKIRKKCRFDTFFGQFSTFRKSQNAVNYSIFAFNVFCGSHAKTQKML